MIVLQVLLVLNSLVWLPCQKTDVLTLDLLRRNTHVMVLTEHIMQLCAGDTKRKSLII